MLDWEERLDDFGRPGLHSLRLSVEAKVEHHLFAEAIEVQMRPGGDLEHFTDWAGKARAQQLDSLESCMAQSTHMVSHGEPKLPLKPCEMPAI